MSFTTTLAPRSASSSACARPRLGLPPAPVTTAVRPSKRNCFIASLPPPSSQACPVAGLANEQQAPGDFERAVRLQLKRRTIAPPALGIIGAS